MTLRIFFVVFMNTIGLSALVRYNDNRGRGSFFTVISWAIGATLYWCVLNPFFVKQGWIK